VYSWERAIKHPTITAYIDLRPSSTKNKNSHHSSSSKSPLIKQSTCIMVLDVAPPLREVFHHHGSWIYFGKHKDITDQEMVHFFGAMSIVCVAIWRLLGDKGQLKDSSKPKHLIVALYYNKKYPTVTKKLPRDKLTQFAKRCESYFLLW
jgi:hypothetical protein